MGQTAGQVRRERAIWWGRLVAPMVAVLIAATGGALALVSSNVANRQERQLVHERAAELVSALSLTLSDIRTMLQAAGSAALDPRRPGQFEVLTTAALATPGASIVVARRTGTGFAAVIGAGASVPAAGTAIAEVFRPTLDRAASARGNLVSGVVPTAARTKSAIIASAVIGTPGAVIFYTSPISGAKPAPADSGSPYHELNVALYAGATVDSSQLIMVSGKVPDAGAPVVDSQFQVGEDTWTLRISASHPLVGSLASLFPVLVAGSGLLLAVFMGLLIHLLVRRRAYALRLVEERTSLLREAQQAAERANNAKSEFLSRMSHELRTPLNAVLGFAQLLELDELSPDQAENVMQIRRGGSWLLELINEILDISQIESGKLSLSPEPVLVSDVIRSALDMVGPLAAERSVNLISTTEREPARYVFADQQRLKQVLLNLLSNAIKYNRLGGSVSVGCFEPSAGMLRIQVTDTGPGIPADQRDLLFVPFERLGAENTSIEGTGVGLALSRGLAKAMGGRLDVDSIEGRGSTFWIEFPIVEDPVQQVPEEDSEAGAQRLGSDQMLVLHIEDNPANVALVERILAQRPGLVLEHATLGRQGLDFALRDRPVLILLDLNLPDVSGAEVLRELRANPRTENIPVIVISADAMPRQVQHLMSAGAAAYLTKPIDIRELLFQIDNVTGLLVEG